MSVPSKPSRPPAPRWWVAGISLAALAVGGCDAPAPPPAEQSAALLAPAEGSNQPALAATPVPQPPRPAPRLAAASYPGNRTRAEDLQTGQASLPQEPSLPQTALEPMPPVVSVYIDPPRLQPPPVLVGIAPPPMLVELPPPMPFPQAVWTGGYWAWHGRWIWSAGRWLAPPLPRYVWVQPYYEHRDNAVVYVAAHWSPPGVVFVPPPPSLAITFSAVLAGFDHGPGPIGPQGIFVPPPPGSRWGLIVPAPIGTAPAVVSSAPPLIHVGARIIDSGNVTTQVINHNTRITNNIINNHITNIRNVTVMAPAASTADGRAFQEVVPASAHLAAARAPLYEVAAPQPVSPQPLAPYVASAAQQQALPAAQAVQARALRFAQSPLVAQAHAPVIAAKPSALSTPLTALQSVPRMAAAHAPTALHVPTELSTASRQNLHGDASAQRSVEIDMTPPLAHRENEARIGHAPPFAQPEPARNPPTPQREAVVAPASSAEAHISKPDERGTGAGARRFQPAPHQKEQEAPRLESPVQARPIPHPSAPPHPQDPLIRPAHAASPPHADHRASAPNASGRPAAAHVEQRAQERGHDSGHDNGREKGNDHQRNH